MSRLVCLFIASLLLSACAIGPVAPIKNIETNSEGFSVPYRISDAGHFLIDVSVNENAPQAFILDTGANVSAIYEPAAEAMGLIAGDGLVSVNGLVGSGLRPRLDGIELIIGPKTYHPNNAILLEASKFENQAIGLLGVDILSESILVFNSESAMVTVLPSETVDPALFSGWRQIRLRNQILGYEDKGLYFTETILKDERVPVLVDTGSDINIINWPLATLDESFKRVQRRLRQQTELHGATESSVISLQTKFFDLQLGQQNWPEIEVLVLDFEGFTDVAPVDKPFMVAGATMFAGQDFAFDFARNRIYIRPAD